MGQENMEWRGGGALESCCSIIFRMMGYHREILMSTSTLYLGSVDGCPLMKHKRTLFCTRQIMRHVSHLGRLSALILRFM